MLINFDKTYELLEERVMSTKDAASIHNKFTIKPKGILVQDSYNNPFFPIKPQPKIDTSKLDLNTVFKRYRDLYSQTKSVFLPWHYCIELVDNRYYIFNTRPLDMKFPINSEESKDNQKKYGIKWDDPTKLFFKDNIFDVSEAVHVCLVGSSELDIYTRQTYSLIGQTCMTPLLRQYKLPGGLYQRVFPLNIGRRFKFENISRFVKT